MRDKLVNRLRGKYAIGPHLPNGEPEFGWRQFESPPIQHEAAEEIERLRDLIERFWAGTVTEKELYEARNEERDLYPDDP
jgi:hypothetical protein